MCHRFLILTAFLLGMSLSQASAQVIQSDFDSDGVSDPTFVTIDSNNGEALNWSARLSSTGELSSLVQLGTAGDQIILGHWKEGNGAQPGVALLSGADIVWRLDDGSEVILGTFDDKVIAGGDFDGNGIADVTTVTKGSALTWKIKLNAFQDSNASVQEIAFGQEGNTPFFLNPDGTEDWLALIVRTGREYKLVLRNVSDGSERELPLLARIAQLGRPHAVANSEGSDILVFFKRAGGVTRIACVDMSGQVVAETTLAASGDLIIGDFVPQSAGEEIAVLSSSGLVLFNPFSQESSTAEFSTTDLIAVDETNINVLKASDEDAIDIPGDGICTAADPFDGSGGFIWKPNSDTQFYAVAILPGTYFRKIKSVFFNTTEGRRIEKPRFKGCANPDADGPRCTYISHSLTGARLRRAYGSIVVQTNLKDGQCYEYSISNPTQRAD